MGITNTWSKYNMGVQDTVVPNHPECKWSFIGIIGPKERRWKIILVKARGKWQWRYKRPGYSYYVLLGTVEHIPPATLCRQIKMDVAVSDIL